MRSLGLDRREGDDIAAGAAVVIGISGGDTIRLHAGSLQRSGFSRIPNRFATAARYHRDTGCKTDFDPAVRLGTVAYRATSGDVSKYSSTERVSRLNRNSRLWLGVSFLWSTD